MTGGSAAREQAIRKPRSVLIANDFPPIASGIATYLSGLWKHIPGDRTSIIAPRYSGTHTVDELMSCPVTRIWLPLGESAPAKVLKTLVTILHMLNLAINRRPLRFHCGQVLSSGLGGMLCNIFFNIPYVLFVYGSETVRFGSGVTGRLMRSILHRSERVFTCSESTREELIDFGANPDLILTVYPCVDVDFFKPDCDSPNAFSSPNHQVLLTVARLDQRKGHDTVLRALATVVRQQTVRYLIAGTGRERERLQSVVDSLGLSTYVRFLGYVPDENLSRLYNACDIFVMPNRVTEETALSGDIEGFGISFVEAGACEKPVIAGRSGGATEAVVDGVTGILVNPESDQEVVDAILRLLNDPSLAKQMGKNARQRIAKCFTWNVAFPRIRDYI